MMLTVHHYMCVCVCFFLQWKFQYMSGPLVPFSHAVMRVDRDCDEAEKLFQLSVTTCDIWKQCKAAACDLSVWQNQDLHTDDQKQGLLHECRRINCCGVMTEEGEKKHPCSVFSHTYTTCWCYVRTYKHTWLAWQQHWSTAECTQISSWGGCSTLAYSSADSFHGDMRLFSIHRTDATRHSQKQHTENKGQWYVFILG